MSKTNLFLFFFLIISLQINANVLDDLIIKKKPVINQILIELIVAGLNDQTDNDNSKLAKEICTAGGGGSSCTNRYSGPKTIAQGICIAGGGGSSCTNHYSGPKTIAQGICIAGGGGSSCTNRYSGPKTIEEAIDNIPFKDRTFWWDQFRDQYGNYQWRCRGGQTKQFANDSKCSGVSKDDDRWPG